MLPELVGQARAFLAKLSKPAVTPSTRCVVGVVGDLALDRFVFGSVDRISPEAPVPVLLVEKTLEQPGCAANVARNLSALMKSIPALELSAYGVVGSDAAGDALVKWFADLGPRAVAGIERDASRPTPLKTRFLAGSQHQLLRVDAESTQSIAPSLSRKIQDSVLANVSNFKCLIVQDYAKGLFSKEFLKELLLTARSKGVPTLVDPNRNTPAEHYCGAALITPNVAEAETLLGRSLDRGQDDALLAQACLEMKKRFDLDSAMITRSRYGITFVDSKNEIFHLPALARVISDVTGAGDTVVASLAAFFAAGASWPVACVLANAAASVVVAKVGTATADLPEIAQELERISV